MLIIERLHVDHVLDKFKLIFLCFMMIESIFEWKNRKFFAHFGVAKATVTILWIFLSSIDSTFKLEHIFWSFYFLKVYSSIDVCSSYWNVDPKTFSHWVWKFLVLMASQNLVFYLNIITLLG